MYERLFKRFGNIRFFAEEGDGGGGGESPDWHGDHDYLKNNPEASKAFGKYADVNEALKGSHEAIKKVGRPYWLPKDHSKLNDTQRDEIRANVAVMDGVPLTPDGYELKTPEGARVDDETLAKFKVFAHERKFSPTKTQELLDFQIDFQSRQDKLVIEASEKLSKDNFDQFSKDCGGDTEAALRMEWIKKLLQSKCTKDGVPDPKMWEDFQKRMFSGDRVIELVLSRALEEPAKKFTEGGAPNAKQKGIEITDETYSAME